MANLEKSATEMKYYATAVAYSTNGQLFLDTVVYDAGYGAVPNPHFRLSYATEDYGDPFDSYEVALEFLTTYLHADRARGIGWDGLIPGSFSVWARETRTTVEVVTTRILPTFDCKVLGPV